MSASTGHILDEFVETFGLAVLLELRTHVDGHGRGLLLRDPKLLRRLGR